MWVNRGLCNISDPRGSCHITVALEHCSPQGQMPLPIVEQLGILIELMLWNKSMKGS